MPAGRGLFVLLYSAIVGAYLLSLAGVLFVAGDAWILGMAAFAATFGTLFLRKGAWFARRPLALPALWKILAPVYISLFLVGVVSSFKLGAPAIGEEPIAAARDHYLIGQTEVPRWRFVAAAASLHLAWHLLGMGFALDYWREAMRDRGPDAAESTPRGGFAILGDHLRKLRALGAKARRGRFSLSHFKRIRRFVSFGTTSVPIFFCVFAVFVVLMVVSAAGWLPFAALPLAFGLLLGAVWVGWALDLVIAVWERDVVTSLWMLLWVAGFGYLTLKIFQSAVSGG